MKRILLSFFLILSYNSISAQATTEIKLDAFGLTHGAIRLSVERQFTPKFGLDVGLGQSWDKLYVGRVRLAPPVSIGSTAMDFRARDFEFSLMANYFPFAKEDHFVEFMISPVAHATWRTYVDPEYYDAYKIVVGSEAPDPYRYFPKFSVGLALGAQVQAKAYPRITLESSFSFEWVFSAWFRHGYGRDFTSFLAIRVGYILQAKEKKK